MAACYIKSITIPNLPYVLQQVLNRSRVPAEGAVAPGDLQLLGFSSLLGALIGCRRSLGFREYRLNIAYPLCENRLDSHVWRTTGCVSAVIPRAWGVVRISA